MEGNTDGLNLPWTKSTLSKNCNIRILLKQQQQANIDFQKTNSCMDEEKKKRENARRIKDGITHIWYGTVGRIR